MSEQLRARAPERAQQQPDRDGLDDDGDSTVVVTFFSDHAATTKREDRLSPEALAELIHTTTAASKEALPWLKLARFGENRSKGGALRNNDNVVAVTGVEADYDRGEMSLAEANDIIASAGITAGPPLGRKVTVQILAADQSATSMSKRLRALSPPRRSLHW